MNVKNKIYSVLGAILVIGLVILSEYYDSYRINKYSKYTIGKVTGIHKMTRGGIGVKYHFDCFENHYICNIPTDLNSDDILKLVDKRFLVIFDSTKPSRNYLRLEHEFSDSIIAPIYGWKEIPLNNNQTTHNNM